MQPGESDAAQISRRLLITGKVQGVFYRAWTEQNARALGISGWVRNLSTGQVEALVCGPTAAVDEMVRRCWQGPPAASVDDVQVEESGEDPPEGFVQIRTR